MAILKPNFTTTKNSQFNSKTFSIFLLTKEQYENEVSIECEDENLFFQDQSVEMEGHCCDITNLDETSMWYSMNLSVERINEIKNSECVVITSIYN